MSHAQAVINGHTVSVTGPNAPTELVRLLRLSGTSPWVANLRVEPDGWLMHHPTFGIRTACAGESPPSFLPSGSYAEPLVTVARVSNLFNNQLKEVNGNQASNPLIPTTN